MLANDIAEYLEDQSVGTVGSSIFIGFMPDTVSNCIAVYEYAGNSPENVGDIEHPRLTVRIRNSTYANGQSKAKDVLNKLHTLSNTALETHSYLYIRAVGSINALGRDAENRALFSVDFIVTKIMEA